MGDRPEGAAKLRFDGDDEAVELRPGDFVNILGPQAAPGRMDSAG